MRHIHKKINSSVHQVPLKAESISLRSSGHGLHHFVHRYITKTKVECEHSRELENVC